jgi:SAM-dependent methyltransferase
LHDVEQRGIGDDTYFTRWYGDRTPEFYTSILAEMIRFGRPGPIVDLGCGTGLFVQLATQWGLDASGFDGSIAAVEMGLRRWPNLRIQQTYLSEPLPCSDELFDNVLLNQVVEHLPPPILKNVLSESFRVLKKGGVLFIYSPSRVNKRQVEMDPTHCNPLCPSELRKYLEGVGFTIIREPNTALILQNSRFLRKMADWLLRIGLADWVSATTNAYAVRVP